MKLRRAKRFIQMGSLVGGMMMFLVAGQAHALLIDTFDTDQGPVIVETTSTTHDTTVTGGGVIGGEREMLVHCGTGCSNLKRIFGVVDNGVFSHSQDQGVTGYTVLTWDGTTGGDDALSVDANTGFGDTDFTDGGSEIGLYYKIIDDDVNFDLTFTAYTDAGNYSNLVVSHSGPITDSNFVALYSNFSTVAGLGVDFQHVRALQLRIEASAPNLDMSFDFIRTTGGDDCVIDCNPNELPEPGTWILFGTGLIGVAGYGWRRNKGLTRI